MMDMAAGSCICLSDNLFQYGRARDVLDWDTINKLMINEDFDAFIQRITKDINYKEIRQDQYDPILDKEGLIDLGLVNANSSSASTVVETLFTSQPSKRQETEKNGYQNATMKPTHIRSLIRSRSIAVNTKWLIGKTSSRVFVRSCTKNIGTSSPKS